MEEIKLTLEEYKEGVGDIKNIDDLIIQMKYNKAFNGDEDDVPILEVFEDKYQVEQESETKDSVKLKDEEFYKSKMSSFDL